MLRAEGNVGELERKPRMLVERPLDSHGTFDRVGPVMPELTHP